MMTVVPASSLCGPIVVSSLAHLPTMYAGE
jgi:hypothetical protein